jgi:hypothetical protein
MNANSFSQSFGRLSTMIAFCLAINGLLESTALTQSCLLPPHNMIAWWSADGHTVDITGLGHNGTLVNGATYAPGKVGQAFSFNGTNSYVQVPKSRAWDFDTKDFSIDLWVNFTTVKNSGSIGEIDNTFIADDQGPFDVNKWVFTLSAGVLTFHINGPNLGPQFLAQTPFSPTPGTWYLVSVTKASGTYTMWIDGVPSTATSQTFTTAIPPPNVPLTIGEAESLGFVDGFIDEVEIFSRALTASEMLGIFNAGSTGKCKPALISPPSLGFAPEPIGITSSPKKFTLTNYQNAKTLNITKIALGGTDPQDFAITGKTCGATLTALAKCTISVTFTPTATNQRTAQLIVSDNAFNTPQVAQLIGLPEASLSPSSHNFGTVKTGTTSSPVKFTLTNNQAVTLNSIGITFAGTDAGDFKVSSTTCSSSLAAKSHCSISVTFTPGATGARSGVLIVTDNAVNSPQTAQLQGTGG